MNIKNFIAKKIKKSINLIGLSENLDPIIRHTQKKNLGDYQANGIIKIAKKNNLDPMYLANRIISLIKNYKVFKQVYAVNPGFINFFINEKWLEKKINQKFYLPYCGINRHCKTKKIVVDYSSPNMSKDMHIGHLRSTVLGDVIVRLSEFLGHEVIRANHIGDWGTQFGMIIALCKEKTNILKKNKINLKLLEKLYQQAKKKFDSDQQFAKKSFLYIKKLYEKDPETILIWKKIVNCTIQEHDKLYRKLNITLTTKDIKGESSYHKMIPDLILDLKEKKIAVTRNNETIVLLNEFKNRAGNPMGIVIQKQDSIFLYATIDLACLKYRCHILKADRILYYTDIRQSQYFNQIKTIGIKAKFISKNNNVEHHMFGMMLSKDKKPFKTRNGNNIKLSEVIKKAINKARILTRKKQPNISHHKINSIAKKIGIGAIKYADLSKHRMTDYIFDWENMLSFEGNTASYIQYTYTRILSILKKNNINLKLKKQCIHLKNASEIELSLKLLQFEELINEVFELGLPHLLCLYLYKLSVIFSHFYEKHSILHISNKNIKISRLKLSLFTAKILKKGLNLLGIQTMNNM
ncbi:Arginine--tRNA ligase [Buchnera aphidicola (Thelaxes suberi)]|uniref:arginine--tRNA ligase n=1 Tax=Buchnera aphidicola TaxID=9 RepID=UPI00346450EE